MARFTTVLFHPPTRFPQRQWDDDPDVAAWLGTSRRVCDGYSRHLAALGVQGRHSTLQLQPRPGTENLLAGGVVRARVNIDRFEGSELGHVEVPHGTAALGSGQRGRLVLETVHALVVQLGQFRGWSAADVAPAREQALAEGCTFVVASPWKYAPGRSLAARVVHRLTDVGFGRATLEVRDAEGTVTEVGPALSFSTGRGFDRSLRTLRWHGKDMVDVVPYVGLFGDQRGVLRWTADGRSVVEPPPLPEALESPVTVLDGLAGRVVVRPDGDTLPDRSPRIRVIGGGPTNGIPGTYLVALHHLTMVVQGDAWQDWWRPSGERLLEIGYDLDPRRPGHSIRRTTNRVRARIDRPTPTIIAAPDRLRLALDDVVGLMTAVGSRFGLGALPWLPSRDEIATTTAVAVVADEQRRTERDREL